VRPDFYPKSLKEILPLSRFAFPKTAQIWAERIAQCERSNAPVVQFCQSINCSPTPFYQWKCDLAAKHQTIAFLRVQGSEPTKDSIEIKLPEAGARREAIVVREQPNRQKTLVRSSAGI
jgi:hypothetical protein